MPNKKAMQALINNPDNWLRGEMPGGPGSISAVLGRGQALPTARDAVEIAKRLRGGLSRVPSSVKHLLDVPVAQSVKDMFHPSAMAMQERMFRQNNPIFKRMEAEGVFGTDRYIHPLPDWLK